MSGGQTDPSTIDDYIAAFPEDVRALLEQIRAAIREAAPDAQETMSYRMPAFKLRGRDLAYFAAYKKHIGLYPAPTGHAEFQEAVEVYGAGKGTLRFPLDQPIPLELVRRIVRFRAKEIADRAEAKLESD